MINSSEDLEDQEIWKLPEFFETSRSLKPRTKTNKLYINNKKKREK